MKNGRNHPGRDVGKFTKARVGALIFCVFLLAPFIWAPAARAFDASIVIDADSDMVISQMNPDRLLHPASMSKLMTLYLTFEALDQGRITLQRSFPVSAHAASMSPTKLGLPAGQSIRVEDAILSLVTVSANDMAVVLAEGLGGSEDRFGQLMTRKAHQLGMVNTNFRNANGLPDPAQISTARDMAILCRALIRRFPQYYHYFSTREFTYNGVIYANHNHLMSRYEGMDGLKTGLTNASGFNLAASAVRNGRRLIGVVYGGTSALQRDEYMAGLLDDGFRRAGVVAMTAAAPPPVPRHKPSEGGIAGLPTAPTPLTPAPPAVEPAAMASLPPPDEGAAVEHSGDAAGALSVGEGDSQSPEDMRPIAPADRVAMIAPAPSRPFETPAASSRRAVAAPASWSIQIGAYATRKATERAIRQAVLKAPDQLRRATPVVAALPRRQGTLYRGRLTGLDAAEARLACRKLAHCMTVPPSGQ